MLEGRYVSLEIYDSLFMFAKFLSSCVNKCFQFLENEEGKTEEERYQRIMQKFEITSQLDSARILFLLASQLRENVIKPFTMKNSNGSRPGP